MRKGLIAAGFAAILLWVTPFTKAEIDSNYIDQGGVRYYIQTDKDVYNLGENVNILYRVNNLTDFGVSLGMLIGDDLAFYDFKITQDDNLIWRYPYISGAMGVTTYHLAPHETKEFQTIWNMMNDNGTRMWSGDDFCVSPGMYNVFGEVAVFQTDQRVPVSVSVDIIPEPTTMLLFGAGLIGLLSRNRRNPKH